MKSNLLKNLLASAGILITYAMQAQAPVANFSVSTATVCAESPIQVTDQSTNLPTAWSYSVNGVLYSTVQNPEVTFTVAGTYSIDLEASNANGTSSIFSQTVFVNSLPTITVSGNTLVCTSASSTLSASGADTYSWNAGPGTATVTINPSANTIYTLTGTSTLTGCSDTSFVSISTIPLPTIAVSDGTICPGQSFTLSPGGATTYSYSGGSAIVSPTATAIYTVTGTDASTGCSDSVAVAVTVNNVSITANTGSVCSGQNYTIVPAGAATYTFSGGTNVVSPTVATTYTIYGTDSNGCSGSSTVTIGVLPSPSITVNSGSICAGWVFTLQPTGAATFSYSSGSSTVAPGTSTSYIVSGMNMTTGCIGYATAFVTVSPLPSISINNATICAGDIFTLNPVGAATYTFSSGGPTVMPSSTTVYSITGTTSNGCVSQSAAVVTIAVSGTKPSVSIVSSNPGASCAGESVVLTAYGATSYSWSTGAVSSTAVVNPTGSTIFLVTGTDVLSGCSSVASLLQYVSECSGIEKYTSDLNVQVYPNPTRGDLTIDAEQEMNVSVINTLGAEVVKLHVEAGQTTINLAGQPDGVYFLHLKKNSSVKTVRIIKH